MAEDILMLRQDQGTGAVFLKPVGCNPVNGPGAGDVSRDFGRMYRSERTPDGYYVGPDGTWDGNPADKSA